MPSGYGGRVGGTVTHVDDPLQQGRVGVIVPQISQKPMWALPCYLSDTASLPSVGQNVVVSFERGDSDFPIWELGSTETGFASGQFPGKYRGVVVDSTDPAGQNRLRVQVPDVFSSDSVWATRSPWATGSGPGVGAEVWVEFEGGDPERPVWVGGLR